MYKKPSTLLQRLVDQKYPLKLLTDALTSLHYAPLASLILSSDAIADKAKLPWDYKSLADLGAEDFIANGEAFWTDDPQDWLKYASGMFSESVYRWAWYEELDGLQFWVRESKTAYRLSKKGDNSYDFVCQLREHEALSSQVFTKAPRWANDLFVFRPNFEAYSLIFGSEKGTADPEYLAFKNAKAAAVLAETERRTSGAMRVAASIAYDVGAGDASEADRQLATRERNTLLTIIGLLLEAGNYDFTTPSKTATLIENQAQLKGLTLARRTIEEHIKRVRAAMESRSK